MSTELARIKQSLDDNTKSFEGVRTRAEVAQMLLDLKQRTPVEETYLKGEIAKAQPASSAPAPATSVVTPKVAPAATPTAPVPADAPMSMLEHALDAVRRGFYVFPCLAGGKAPATKNGLLDATNDVNQIKAWWTKDPNYNPAVNLEMSGKTVRDYDLVAPLLAEELQTLVVKSGRINPEGQDGGYHCYYDGLTNTRPIFVEPVLPLRETQETDKKGKTHTVVYDALNRKVVKGRVAVGEIRSRGAYVIWNGAMHKSGNRYQITNDVPMLAWSEPNEVKQQATIVPVGTEEQERIALFVEAAFDASKTDFMPRTAYQGGFRWLVDCPWDYNHEGVTKNISEKGSSCAVFMAANGKLGFKCQHAHCMHLGWSDFRSYMEQQAGHLLQFGDKKSLTLNQSPLTSTPSLEVRDVAEDTSGEASSDALVLPESTIMSSTVLGKLYQEVFKPKGWCVELALPALATAASVLVPEAPNKEGVISFPSPFTHLYTALIGPVNGGKSSVNDWASMSLGIYADVRGPHAINVKFGSAEQMWRYMAKHQATFKGAVLVNPDEWAHVMAKAGIPDSSFVTNLTTAFYKRRHGVTLGGSRGGMDLEIPFPFSMTGGVVEEEFDSVFGATSLGGLYDRFLLGLAPKGFSWVYRPFPVEHPHFQDLVSGKSCGYLKTNPVPVTLDGSVFEVSKSWKDKDAAIGRITEVCIRVATIFASIDGRSVLTGDDLEKLWPLAEYQKGIRELYQPNAGLNPDAVYANAALKWIDAHAQQWRTFRDLQRGTNVHRKKLGPNVASRALKGLAQDHLIDMWVSTLEEKGGKWVENDMPADYRGKRPKYGAGLVRKASSD